MSSVQSPLSDVILRLQAEGCAGNVLIIEDTASGYYIQIAGSNGSPQLHVEAVGNTFLEAGRQLSPDRQASLEQLGWSAPAKGCPNYSIDCQIHDADGREWLAALIMKTFSDVYGVGPDVSLEMQLNLESALA